MKATPQEICEYIKYYYYNISNALHIFPDAKLLYFFNAKSASSSIKDSIQDYLGGPSSKICGEANWKKWVDNLTPEIIQEYYIFTFVRNPFSRMLSVANHFKVPLRKAVEFANNKKHSQGFYTHSIPASTTTHTLEGKQIADFIGHCENIQDDWQKLCDEIEMKIELKYINKSQKSANDYIKHYNENTRQKVAQIYKKDLDLLGYK